MNNDSNNQKLIESARVGNAERVKTLIAKGADPNFKDDSGWTPLHHASERGHAEVVRILLCEDCIDPNVKCDGGGTPGWTPLHQSSNRGHVNVVRLLIAHKSIDVNANTKTGKTPLQLAKYGDHKEVVKLLEKAGAIMTNYVEMIEKPRNKE